jgi:hypothetical protein
MNLNRWLTIILMMGLILALTPLGAQAGPYPHFEEHPRYRHPHGKAYGWHGARHHAFDRHHKHFRHYAHHAGPPPVAYVTPVAPVVGIPFAQPQPYFPQPGLSGHLQWNF